MGHMHKDTPGRVRNLSDALLNRFETGIAQTPYEVVYQEDRVRLKHFAAKKKSQYNTPMLMVYSLINRETMLDLQPGKSVVERLLGQGIDLYMIDWGFPENKDRFLGFDDHINGYMDNIVDFICRKSCKKKINLMGICMGGTFCVIYSSLYPEKIRNLVTAATPTDFNLDKGVLYAVMKRLDVDTLVETYGNLPGHMINMGFLLLNPAKLMIDKYAGLMAQLDQKEFVENFIRMEKWIFDCPDLPGEVFRKLVTDCFQKNKLIQNQLTVGGRPVDLKAITMPVLNFYGKYDHLVPPLACNRLTREVGSKDIKDICLDSGHIGICVSSKCQNEFAPKIASWLKKRDSNDQSYNKTTLVS